MKKIICAVLFCFLVFELYAYPWYKSQIGTGIGNCGPTSVAIVEGAVKHLDVSVQQTRKLIGYSQKDGSTSVDEILYMLRSYKIKFHVLSSLDFDACNIYIICINTALISNRSYSYIGGHYIVITGEYGSNFIVQDPLGGEDQLYNKKEVLSAIRFNYIIKVELAQ